MEMKNRILILCIVLVVMCGSTALALDPMGPPASGLNQGQFSLGFEYSTSEVDLYREQSYSSSGHSFDIETDKYFVRLGYGISEKTEGFVRLGLSDYEYERGTYPGSGSWKGDDDAFAMGLGLKTTFSEDGNLKWGGLAQISWAEYSGSRKNPNASSEQSGSFETEITELQLAAGPTYTLMEGVSVYGGPFLHIVNGDHSHKHASGTGDYGVNEVTNFGAYIGAQVDLAANTALNIEYQDTGDAWALAGGVKISF
jgi:opacity protein-like surface antigen